MEFKVGDRVGYARAWLQSVTNGDPTDPLWQKRGKVVQVEAEKPYIVVAWDGEEEFEQVVLWVNVAVTGSHKFAHEDAKGWVGHEGLGEKPRSKWKKEE